MSIASPPTREVSLSGGPKVRIRPWTMAQRDDLRPKVVALLEQVSELQGGFTSALSLNLVMLFIKVEDEVCDIVRHSIPLDELSETQWGVMEWADLPNLAQAVWELNVARSDGLMGKVAAGLGSMLGNALVQAAQTQAGVETDPETGELSLSSIPKSETTLRPVPSPSSPDAGAATPST